MAYGRESKKDRIKNPLALSFRSNSPRCMPKPVVEDLIYFSDEVKKSTKGAYIEVFLYL